MPFIKGQSGNPKGRPRKADAYAGAIARAEKKIADKLPWLVDQMLELATGVLVEELDKDGTPRVYQRPPDRQAIEYLANRIMGKPTERNDVTISAEQWIFDPSETTNPPAADEAAA